VADLLALLEEHTLVQSLNGYCRTTGEVELFPGDLGDPDSVSLLVDETIQHNFVSITGTAHSRAFYERVGKRWDTTPPGQWPDHHQFRRLIRHPDFRGATSHRMTALQLPTSEEGRDAWTDADREAELARWHAVVVGPDAQAVIDEKVRASVIPSLVRHSTAAVRLRRDAELLRAEIDGLRST